SPRRALRLWEPGVRARVTRRARSDRRNTAHAVHHEEEHRSPQGLERRGSHRASLQARGQVMPVRKFRDVSEMEDSLWHDRGDPALFRAMRSTWEFASRTVGLRFPPGVHKYRSFEAADAQREIWGDVNHEAFQSRRRRR